jgi:hypothetical protein
VWMPAGMDGNCVPNGLAARIRSSALNNRVRVMALARHLHEAGQLVDI